MDWENLIAKASAATGVHPNLLRAVMMAESSGNPRDVSRTGAQGLMQLMPGTARSLGVRNAFDPQQNLMGGAKYLAQNLKLFGGDVSRALAAYNAGPGAVQKFGGIPPYPETQKYVRNVMGLFGQPFRGASGRGGRQASGFPSPFGGAPAAPAPDLRSVLGDGQSLNLGAVIQSLMETSRANPINPAYVRPVVEDGEGMGWNGALGAIGGMGGVGPQMPEMKTLPSLVDNYGTAMEEAAKLAPNPYAPQELFARTQAEKENKLAQFLDANPMPQMGLREALGYVDMPHRQAVALPDRVRPQVDPLSQGIATLAGLFQPASMGALAGIPYRSAVESADRATGDARQRYALERERADTEFGDRLQERQATLQHAQQANAVANENSQIGYQNLLAARNARLQSAQLGAQGDASGALAQGYGQMGKQSSEYSVAQTKAGLLGQQVKAAGDEQARQDELGYRRGNLLMQGMFGLQNAQIRGDTSRDVAQTGAESRQAVANTMSESRIKAAEIGKSARIATANIQAQVRQTLAKGKFSAVQQNMVNRLGQRWTQATHNLDMVGRSADKEWTNYKLMNPSADEATWKAQAVANAKAAVEQARSEWESAVSGMGIDATTGQSNGSPTSAPASPSGKKSGKSGLQGGKVLAPGISYKLNP